MLFKFVMLSWNEKDDNARLFHFLSPRVSAPAYLHQTKRHSTLFSSSTNVSSSKSPSSPPRKNTSMAPSSSPMLPPPKLPAVSPSKSPSSHRQIVPAHLYWRAQYITIKEPSTSPSKSPAQQSSHTPSASHNQSSWCHHWKTPASLHWGALARHSPRVWVSPIWSPQLSALWSSTNWSECRWGRSWTFVTDVATVAWKQ